MEVLARAHELGDHEVFDDEENQEDEQTVAQPPRDDRSQGAGRRRLGTIVGVHLSMFSARAVPTMPWGDPGPCQAWDGSSRPDRGLTRQWARGAGEAGRRAGSRSRSIVEDRRQDLRA